MSWERHIIDGISALRRSDLPNCERSLKDALQIAKEGYGKQDSRFAMTLSMLGQVYFKQGNFSQAELLLEQSLRLHTQDSRATEPCLLMDLFSLAEIKKHKGEQGKALKLYDETLSCLRMLKTSQPNVIAAATMHFETLADCARKDSGEKLMPVSSVVAGAASNYQNSMFDHQDYFGHSTYDTVFVRPEDDHGGGSRSRADSRQSRGPARLGSGTPLPDDLNDQADKFRNSMVDLWQKQFENGKSLLAADDEETESLVSAYLNLESAWKIARTLLPETDFRRVQTLAGLAAASGRLHMLEQAENLYWQAIELGSACTEASTNDIAMIKLDFAVFCAEFDMFAQAKKVFDEAVENLKLTGGTPDEEAKKSIERMLEREKLLGSAYDLLDQCAAAEEMSDFEKASKLYNNVLAQLKQGFPPDYGLIGKVIGQRARILKLCNHESQAAELEKRSERISKSNQAETEKWTKLSGDLPKPSLEPAN